MIRCAIIGRVMSEEIKVTETPRGTKVANVDVVANSGYGEKKASNYFRCRSYGIKASIMAEVKKGALIYIDGSLSFYTASNGKVYNQIDVLTFDILNPNVLDSKEGVEIELKGDHPEKSQAEQEGANVSDDINF